MIFNLVYSLRMIMKIYAVVVLIILMFSPYVASAATEVDSSRRTVSLAASTSSRITNHDWAKMINIAGRQRMLTQLMSKSVILIWLKHNVKQNVDDLYQAQALFNKSLNALQHGDPSLNLKSANLRLVNKELSVFHSYWQPYQRAINAILHDANQDIDIDERWVNYIVDNNESLLREANHLVTMLVQASGTEHGLSRKLAETINHAGRQRMLSQRLAKEVSLIFAGIDNNNYRHKLSLTLRQFNNTHLALKNDLDSVVNEPQVNNKIHNNLILVETLLNQIQPIVFKVINGAGISANELSSVNKNCLLMMKTMDEVVSQYETQA